MPPTPPMPPAAAAATPVRLAGRAPWRYWMLVAALLGAGSLLLAAAGGLDGDQRRYGWDWQPALVWPQPWRVFTAAFVHWSGGHLLANLAGLALLAWLGRRAGCGRAEALAWALAWPLTHLGLWLQPGLVHYGGLSGVLHAGVAVVGWRLLRHGPGDLPRARWVGRLMLAGLTAKVAMEQPWGDPLRRWPGWEIAIAPLAHATGAAAGLLCALAVARISRDWGRAPWPGAEPRG